MISHRSARAGLAFFAASAIALLISGCESMPDHAGSGHAMNHATKMPLFDDLGTHTHKITTSSPEAQAYFNQGYRYLFNFNHAAAISSFQEALKRDANCAMCWWGIAFAYGPNINMPMMPDAHAPANEAIKNARRLAPGASRAEQAYIAALATRYADDPAADRAKLDKAFAKAMRKVMANYPKDLDAATLYAEALMDTSPWDYWRADRRTPKAGLEPLVPTIERIIKRDPKHAGALHLYIHAVEASTTPGRAEKAADTLATLLPGAGHLVHMPTHIYNRIGRYDDGVIWNQKAARADEAYFKATQDRGMYAAMYYVHNLHFVWTAATNDGRSALALEYAGHVVGNIQPQMARDIPGVEAFVPTLLYAQLRFGKWDDVLAAPRPDPELHFASAIYHYARARAFAAKGDIERAAAEQAKIRPAFSQDDAEKFDSFGVPGTGMIAIADHVAKADIARAQGQVPETIKHLRAAVAEQRVLKYTEPPWWDFPTRQFLGAALLEAGRAREAEEVYRDDLKEWPKIGWSLFGLVQALERQGKTREAADARAAFEASWTRADVKLKESRF
jgi:tetratricopeptide (TPR) repeat protein